MSYRSTKTYGHEIGLSCCFRQWRAASHCRHLHGYAISVRLEFEATELDHNNWVVDFGGLKDVRKWLEAQFDHTLLVAQDDPGLPFFTDLMRAGLARVVVLPKVGCEAFAKIIADHVALWTFATYLQPNDEARVRLVSVEVREHGANSAIYVVPADDVISHSDARQAALEFGGHLPTGGLNGPTGSPPNTGSGVQRPYAGIPLDSEHRDLPIGGARINPHKD